MSQKTIEVETKRCPTCNESVIITLPQDGYIAWKRGALIQNAFPDLSSSDRERLITGLCPKCWDEVFKDNGEDISDDEPSDEDLAELAGVEASSMGGPGPEDKDQEEEPDEDPNEDRMDDRPKPKPVVTHPEEEV